MNNNILNAMHYYVDLGLPVIPVCPADEATHNRTSPGHQKMCKCNGKVPLIAGWVNRSETTEENIEQWKEQFSKLNINIGLPLGSASGYIGIDIDGEEGEEIFREMAKGEVPETWEYKTGAGRRLLYAIPVGLQTKKIKQQGDGKHTECAILCTGQQTVLPPSVHHSGRVYTWSEGKSPNDIDCAMAPNWLIEMVKYDKPKHPLNLNLAAQPEHYVADMINMDSEFVSEEFDNFIPEELTNLKSAEVKKQVTKKDKQKELSDAEKILNTVVSEGGRDNAMTQIIGYYMSNPAMRNLDKDMFMSMMQAYNLKYMDPPLESETVATKVDYFWEIEAQKTASYKSIKSAKQFQPTQAAQMVLNLLKEKNNLLIDYEARTGTFYTTSPNIGPWVARQGNYIQTIRALVRNYIENEQYGDSTWGKNHYIDEVISALKDHILLSNLHQDVSFDLHDNTSILSKYIVVDGKLLDWRANKLLPWDPNVKATYSFNVGYTPEATCPHWEQYMKEWVPEEGSRQLLQEFFGYCLIPDTKLSAFVILSGSGRNGKSMLLNYMKELFQETASTLSTAKMTERFGKAGLYGKLINICTEDEGDNGYIKNTDVIKAITSGDDISAEFKGKDVFKFKPTARLIFATNNIPRSKDKTEGWYRRQVIITFPNQFKNDINKAREMEFYMGKEKAGIFNWMLEGLRRVIDRGDFVRTEDIQRNQADFKAINDPLEGFLQECTRPITEEEKAGRKRVGVSTQLLYKVYAFWCRDNYGDKAKQYTAVQRTFTDRMRKEKGFQKNKGYCLIRNDNKQQIFFDLVVDIKNEDMLERMMHEFDGFSMIEDEGILYSYYKKLQKEE